MSFDLTDRDLTRLVGVHADQVAVVKKCASICPFQFFVIEGLRTLADEKKAVAAGKSQTMNSRHLGGFATDLGVLISGKLTWEPSYYTQLNAFMQTAATYLKIPIIWGGSWKTLKDLDHWELCRIRYPDPKPSI